MKKEQLISYLEKHYPASAAEGWDNVGLLVGDELGTVKHVFLALDLTEPVLEEAIHAGADFVLTHHPMIFSGIKQINHKSFTGRKILSLIRHDMTYYAMHTNYDVLGMGSVSAKRLKLQQPEVLEVTSETAEQVQGIGCVGNLEEEMTLRDYAQLVKDAFQISEVRVYGELEKNVKCVAVCTGSGKSMIKEAIKKGAQVYVTGDIDHHTGIDAVADGLCLIDAGHYGTEYMFMEEMKKELSEAFPELTISTAKVEMPYHLL